MLLHCPTNWFVCVVHDCTTFKAFLMLRTTGRTWWSPHCSINAEGETLRPLLAVLEKWALIKVSGIKNPTTVVKDLIFYSQYVYKCRLRTMWLWFPSCLQLFWLHSHRRNEILFHEIRCYCPHYMEILFHEIRCSIVFAWWPHEIEIYYIVQLLHCHLFPPLL